jgi:hypothetical protein
MFEIITILRLCSLGAPVVPEDQKMTQVSPGSTSGTVRSSLELKAKNFVFQNILSVVDCYVRKIMIEKTM